MARVCIYTYTSADKLYFTCLKYNYEESFSVCFVAGPIK